AEAWFAERRGHTAPDRSALRSVDGTPSPLRLLAFAYMSLHFIGAAWGPFIGSRVRAPLPLVADQRWLCLRQPFGLFDVVYDVPHWEAPGRLRDGSAVDVIAGTEPELSPQVAWSFSRWNKFLYKGIERPYRWPEMGQYLCRRWADKNDTSLASFAIVQVTTPTRKPDGSQAPAVRTARWRHECAPAQGVAWP